MKQNYSSNYPLLSLVVLISGYFTAVFLQTYYENSNLIFYACGISLILLSAVLNGKKSILRLTIGFIIFFLLGWTNAYLQDPSRELRVLDFQHDHLYKLHITDLTKNADGLLQGEAEVNNTIRLGRVLPLHFKTNIRSMSDIKIGDILWVKSRLNLIQNSTNPGGFQAKDFYNTKNIFTSIYVKEAQFKVIGNKKGIKSRFSLWRNTLSQNMEKHLKGDVLALSKALILGDKSFLESDINDAFSATGALHVLAVSGMHVGIILLFFNLFFQQFPKIFNKKRALLFAILIAWAYAFISGASPAVLRAAVGFTVLFGGQLFERKASAIHLLLVSALILAFYEPKFIFDLGFQLSYLAIIGILLLHPRIEKLLRFENKWIQKAWSGTSVGIAATLFTCPLTIYKFYQFPNYFALANLGLMVFGFLLLFFGLLFLFLQFVPGLVFMSASILSLCAAITLFWVSGIASWPGAISGGFQLNELHVFVAYLFLSFIIFLPKEYFIHQKTRIIYSTCLFLFLGLISVQRFQFFHKKEAILLRANNFSFIIQDNQMVYAVVKDFFGQTKDPKEAKAYCRYYGKKLKLIRLEKNVLNLSITGNKYIFEPFKDNVKVTAGKHSFTYYHENYSFAKEKFPFYPRFLEVRYDAGSNCAPYRFDLN